MWVGVLGVTLAALGDTAVDLGSRRPRALVCALALHRGRSVPTDTIVDLLWGDEPPASYLTTLHAYISGLRRVLEPDRAPRAPSTVLVTTSTGYRLELAPDQHDVAVFESTVSQAHQALGVLAPFGVGTHATMSSTDLRRLGVRLDEALGLWRGTPFEDLGDAPVAVAERSRLEELRTAALEDRAMVELALGGHSVAAAELESLTGQYPLRERLWGLRAVALYRAGRQADALDVLGQVRRLLDEELGLEPGHDLRALQTAILQQDPSLAWVARGDGPTGAASQAMSPDGGAPVPAPSRPVARTQRPAAPPWPTVGREKQLHALVGALDGALEGRPSFAALVGEPGIGKTRLAYELVRTAYDRDVRVALGRCSQDDGAPPLWPWTAVFESLGAELPQDVGAEDEGSRFRTWHAITRAVIDAATEAPLLVVLDDLHWADVSTLRVLRMLAEQVEPAGSTEQIPLLVLATWRDSPEPTGALADVIETLARRHAVRIDLTGLSDDEASSLVTTVAGCDEDALSSADAHALRQRTDGNPFFLVEYARLAERGDAVGSLLTDPDPPAVVNDVLVRRVRRLPEPTQRRLGTASAIGRSFDLATLAEASDGDVDATLDDLEPAIAAGLLRVIGPDEFLFAHALVRDSVYAGLGARRTRTHARIAEAIARASQRRESELARHWLSAGPAHGVRAREAAVVAAAEARRVHAYDEAVELLRQALEVIESDPACPPGERYDVLLQLADVERWAGDWNGLVATVDQAIEVAEALGDLELVARAAVSATIGALWQSAGHGEVHEGVVAALRKAQAGLPTSDSALRCRVMLGLSNEVYYASTNQERDALTEQAVAMARRLGDRPLLLDVLLVSFVATWRAATAEDRLANVDEALALAGELGDERNTAVAQTLRAVVLHELGRIEEMHGAAELAWETCDRLHLPYGLLVLSALWLPWYAMAGRFEDADRMLEQIRALDAQMSLKQYDDASAGSQLALRLWQGRAAEMLPMLTALDDHSALPVSAAVAMYLGRAGRAAEIPAYLADHPIDFEHDDWFAFFVWGCAAEAAYHGGLPDLAAAAYERLAPFAGRPVCAGSGIAIGPVDAFLALAAVTTGETALASTHADAAAELCQTWDVPLVAAWLQDQRDARGF